MNKQPWIVFFSQTGSEIGKLVTMRNIIPDCIITNRENMEGVDKHLLDIIKNGCKLIHIPKKPAVDDYRKVLKQYKKPLITLHGFLRIIPPEICRKYEIYNLHPGLITEYPELKGKDPQKRTIEGDYRIAGCVIHKVIPEVDCGEIIDSYKIDITGFNFARLDADLRAAALILWNRFFIKKYDTR